MSDLNGPVTPAAIDTTDDTINISSSEFPVKNFFASNTVRFGVTMVLIPLIGQFSDSLNVVPYLADRPELLSFCIGLVGLIVTYLRTITTAPVASAHESLLLKHDMASRRHFKLFKDSVR